MAPALGAPGAALVRVQPSLRGNSAPPGSAHAHTRVHLCVTYTQHISSYRD